MNISVNGDAITIQGFNQKEYKKLKDLLTYLHENPAICKSHYSDILGKHNRKKLVIEVNPSKVQPDELGGADV